ncbi:hypothetical protein HDV02_001485 [Globomyces sp. JEL0801]|nr:hypothetical protein HDV02_001485 [Globomyces sp. JEL0801]
MSQTKLQEMMESMYDFDEQSPSQSTEPSHEILTKKQLKKLKKFKQLQLEKCNQTSIQKSNTKKNKILKDLDLIISEKPKVMEKVLEVPKVEVIEFTDTKLKNSNFDNKKEFRSFMSSNVNKLNSISTLTKKEVIQEDEDDKNDKDLMDLLKTTKLVEQYTSSELTGKDRLNHMKKKIVELGGKPLKPEKISLPIFIGMKKAAQDRVDKKVQNAKNNGIYTNQYKLELLQNEKALRPKSRKKKIDNGIIGSVGKIKNGMMKVSKKIIDAVESGGKRKKKSGGSSKFKKSGSRGKSHGGF